MSETVSFETAISEEASPISETATNTPEYIDPDIDDSELYDLVNRNASEVVELGGVKMTLSEAMIQIPITADNMPQVISLVYELLAKSRQEKQEETDEEKDDKPEEMDKKTEEKDAGHKSEEVTDRIKTDEPAGEKPAQKMEPVQKEIEELTVRSQQLQPEILDDKKPIETKVINNENLVSPAPEVKTISEPEKSLTFEPPARDGREALEVIAQAVSEPAETPRSLGASADTVEPEISLASETPAIESPPNIPIHETSVNEPVKEPETAPPVFNEVEVEQPVLVVDSKAVADFEPEDISALEVENGFNTEEILPIIDESETPKYEPMADIDQIETFDLTGELSDSFEEEVRIEHPEDVWLPVLPEEPIGSVTEMYELTADEEGVIALPVSDEADLSPLTGAVDYEQSVPASYEKPVLISSTAGEIEETMINLAEYIDSSEPETAEMANDILEKIVEVTERFESDEYDIPQIEAHEEIEELFIELLDVIGVEYTPDLTESLARLALDWLPAAENESPEIQPAAGNTAQDSGTHEIIKKILIGLNDSQSVSQACSVGRSALRLYSLQLRLSQKHEGKILASAA